MNSAFKSVALGVFLLGVASISRAETPTYAPINCSLYWASELGQEKLLDIWESKRKKLPTVKSSSPYTERDQGRANIILRYFSVFEIENLTEASNLYPGDIVLNRDRTWSVVVIVGRSTEEKPNIPQNLLYNAIVPIISGTGPLYETDFSPWKTGWTKVLRPNPKDLPCGGNGN